MVSSRSFRVLLTLFVVAIGAVLGIGLFALSRPDASLRGPSSVPPRDVSTVRLTDVDGKEVSFTPPSGNVALAYFGFTHCPDICPTTLSDVRAALSSIGSRSSRVQVDMVTIDPDRDSAPVLRDYLGSFFDKRTGVALRTDDQARLQQVAAAFGASFEVASTSGQPDISHTSWLYAVDDTGHIAAQWSFGTPSKDIAHDLNVLLS
jgi:protein SCO1/2